MLLAEMTSSDVLAQRGKMNLVVPFGSLEAHGPHLPMGTDTMITRAVLEGLPETVRNALVVSPFFHAVPINFVRYEGQDGRANIRISLGDWVKHVSDVIRSYEEAFRPHSMLLVSWHDTPEFIGGLRQVCLGTRDGARRPLDALRLWVLAREYALARQLVGVEERHAAKIETSVMQVIRPDLVKVEARCNVPWRKDPHWVVDWASYTDVGIYGDASQSSAEMGREILDHVVAETTRIISEHIKPRL